SKVSERISTAELVPDERNMLRLPKETVQRLGIQTVQAQQASRLRPLQLAGSLALDTDRLGRVRSRFAGEVTELGLTTDWGKPAATSNETAFRPLRYGDRVQKGQLLAVVWSKDLGEKKSELVDAVSRLRLDQETLKRLAVLFDRGAIPERSYR